MKLGADSKHADLQVVRHVINNLQKRYVTSQNICEAVQATYPEGEDAHPFSSIQKAWGRLKNNFKSNQPITVESLEKFIRPFGRHDLNEYIQTYMPSGVDETLFEKTRAAFSDHENETIEVLERAPGLQANQFYLGEVIELQRFNMAAKSLANKGLDPRDVDLIDTGFEFSVEPSLLDHSLNIKSKNDRKYCLYKTEPADLLDAQDGTLELHVSRTDYLTVCQSDPSIYGEAPANKNNRLKFGSLNPADHKVPYCLTHFFTILLEDDKVLFMRRSPHTNWYRNMIDFSGGENLSEKDFDSDRPFDHWLNRGILEEYFPTIGLDDKQRQTILEKAIGFKRLISIGYHVGSCSHPLFSICKLKLTEQGYLDLVKEIITDINPGAHFDKEGTICILSLKELREFLKTGRSHLRRIFMKRGINGEIKFISPIHDEAEGQMVLTMDDLHPKSPYRMGLLLDCYESA